MVHKKPVLRSAESLTAAGGSSSNSNLILESRTLNKESRFILIEIKDVGLSSDTGDGRTTYVPLETPNVVIYGGSDRAELDGLLESVECAKRKDTVKYLHNEDDVQKLLQERKNLRTRRIPTATMASVAASAMRL
jgi:hypothetical protein